MNACAIYIVWPCGRSRRRNTPCCTSGRAEKLRGIGSCIRAIRARPEAMARPVGARSNSSRLLLPRVFSHTCLASGHCPKYRHCAGQPVLRPRKFDAQGLPKVYARRPELPTYGVCVCNFCTREPARCGKHGVQSCQHMVCVIFTHMSLRAA